MKSDFYTAIAQIAAERGIPREAVLSSVEHALKTVYRKMANTEEEVAVDIEQGTGTMRVFVLKRVVAVVEDPVNEVTPADPLAIAQNAQVGDEIRLEKTPENFGRIAAQTAKQVVLQRIRDYERDTVYEEFQDKEGELLNGTVQRADARAVIVELGKAEAVMPAREQVPNERYRAGQRVKVMLVEVNKDPRGPQLIVSRSHPGLIRRLFESEVPEIFSGAVEIMEVAREPGLRSKVAVAARQEKVDPVGSCVGVRGVRIQNIVNELHGEKIDVIEWASDTAQFIANALSPAKPSTVTLDEANKVATVIVPTDQMSLAIGKEGQNARLAFKLTGWRIDIKDTEALREMDGELLRQARAALADQPEQMGWQGRQPRLVRADALISVRDREFGPLAPELIGMSVDVELRGETLEVYYNRELRARFAYESGDLLPLDEELPVSVPAAAAEDRSGDGAPLGLVPEPAAVGAAAADEA
ncbi:MAG: Transcription termination protein NusA [uncultured Thermomicrobiales bacterium]|uniref:Transcription termination/antitermination protein NusA n=1 Tax=uncultured Thermomicrobiales bacterium TaxID=1645740 RepID=A0A6J4V8J7_9BACT|nr:MAG: Transcription termination protein NusA [uncultured Thermomicrobiales bacterium]